MVSRNEKLLIAVILVLVVLSSSIYYYYSQVLSTPSTTKLTSRITMMQMWPCNLDPCTYGPSSISEEALMALYDTLVYSDWATLAPKPFLATSWDISADGLTYTFHLRNDVKFHDGTSLTAEDVKFSIDRFVTMGAGFSYALAPYIETVSVADNYTVQIVLTKPYGYLLDVLTEVPKILEKQLVMSHLAASGPYGATLKDYGNAWLSQNGAGSGPYVIDYYDVASTLRMKKFDGYWLDKATDAGMGIANPDRAEELWLIAEAPYVSERTMFISGDLEFSDEWGAREDDLALVNAGLNLSLVDWGSNGEGTGYSALRFNGAKPPVDDIHVRKAFAYAFDYQTACQDIFQGYGTPAEIANWTSRQVNSFVMNAPGGVVFTPYQQNMTMAVQELQQSKYFSNISSYPIDVDYFTQGAARQAMAELFVTCVQNLANAAGVTININLVAIPWALFMQKAASAETTPTIMAFAQGRIFLFGDVGEELELYTTKNQGTTSCDWWNSNSTFDSLVEDAISTANRNDRWAALAPLQRWLWNMVPIIPVSVEPLPVVYQQSYVDWYVPRLHVYPPSDTYTFDFRYIGVNMEARQALLDSR